MQHEVLHLFYCVYTTVHPHIAARGVAPFLLCLYHRPSSHCNTGCCTFSTVSIQPSTQTQEQAGIHVLLPSSPTFLTTVSLPGFLCILGDFKFHLDQPRNPNTSKFLHLLHILYVNSPHQLVDQPLTSRQGRIADCCLSDLTTEFTSQLKYLTAWYLTTCDTSRSLTSP